MADHDDVCNTKLALGIGSRNHCAPKSEQEELRDALSLNLSFGLGASRAVRESSKSSSSNDEAADNNNNGIRKKLRLSKEQSTVLEDSFREHTTLNTTQKNSLAAILDLKPRQVEVWFQNRRARTKLKQTEIDCERLKRSCEELTESNKQLSKEIEDLKAWRIKEKAALAAAGASVCSSCSWKIQSAKESSSGEAAAAGVVLLKPKPGRQSGLKIHG